MSNTHSEYAPELFHGHKFGNGEYGLWYPTYEREGDFQAELIRLGWSNGQARIREKAASLKGKPLIKLVSRLGSRNYWYRMIIEQAERENSPLYEYLTQAVPRLEDEIPGFHDPRSVPVSFLTQIAPLSRVEIRGLVNLVAMYRAKLQGDPFSTNKTKYFIYQRVIKPQVPPEQVTARVAERLVCTASLDVLLVLENILPKDLLIEQNSLTAYERLLRNLEKFAPTVWNHYEHLTAKQQAAYDIATLTRVRVRDNSGISLEVVAHP